MGGNVQSRSRASSINPPSTSGNPSRAIGRTGYWKRIPRLFSLVSNTQMPVKATTGISAIISEITPNQASTITVTPVAAE